MSNVQVEMNFTPDKVGGTRGLVIVMQGENVLHSDRIDIAKAKDRTAFINKVKKLFPAIETERIRENMLAEIRRISRQKSEPGCQEPGELDVSRIVRPHLFHIPEVSGLLIPIAQLKNKSQVEGKWLLFIQWADGKRERLDLADYLELGNGDKLWFHPRPATPLPSTVSRWSQQGRSAWLGGYVPKIEEIFQRLCKQFAYFLEFPEEEAIGVTATLSLWTMLTYAYPTWSAVPYLSIGGPINSGKTRVFEVLSQLVYNPLHSSNLTAPCLFRTLHTWGGTLLLDEAERLNDKTPDTGEIRSILLSGYKKGSQAHRMEKVGETFHSVSFDVYGPKAIAGVASLPAALASRCIRIMMFRAGKDSPIPKRRIEVDMKTWTSLRDDLYAMALTKGTLFVELSGWQPECDSINGRDLEVWQPLLAMAKLVEDAGAKGLLEIIKAHALKSLEAVNDDILPEADEILLRLLKEKTIDNPRGITAGELLEAARVEDPALFSRYGARGVGAVLNRYGIKSHRTGGKRYFCPTHGQWSAIRESYGVDLGFTDSENGLMGNDLHA